MFFVLGGWRAALVSASPVVDVFIVVIGIVRLCW